MTLNQNGKNRFEKQVDIRRWPIPGLINLGPMRIEVHIILFHLVLVWVNESVD